MLPCGRTPTTAGRFSQEKAERDEEEEEKVRDGCLSCKMRGERHLNFAWGLNCKHPAQKAGCKGRGRPSQTYQPPCRITAMTDCGEIYRTPLGKVTLVDFKREFESYLAAAEINDGAIPADTEVKVASRLKIFDANSHIDIGFCYAHPNINGRPRYAARQAQMARRCLF